MSAIASLAVLVALSLAPAATARSPGAHASAGNCANATALPARDATVSSERSILCLLNVERAQRGLRKLRMSARLTSSARYQSNDMVDRHYFDHERRGGPGLVKRIRRTGYLTGARSWSVGENIAWGTGSYATPRSLVKVWMDSEGHRKNILNASFREVGVGVTVGAPDAAWGDDDSAATVTTDFGKRS